MADEERSAEEACQRAEELYRAGDIGGALSQATEAKNLCPSLRAATSALAAYQVVAAGGDWRAVLGVRPGDGAAAIKEQFRRLSLLVHPDKNRCAAAEEAFKLLRQALDDALDRSPSDPAGEFKAEEEDTTTTTTGPPCSTSSTPRDDYESSWDHTTTTLPERTPIYCSSCKYEIICWRGVLEELDQETLLGVKCVFCRAGTTGWLLDDDSPSWQMKKPSGGARTMGSLLPLSWRCQTCDTQQSSTVSVVVGRSRSSRLRCEVCTEFTTVYV